MAGENTAHRCLLLQIPELEAHIFTPKLSRSESHRDAVGIFVTCSLEALWRQPGLMLPAAVLCSHQQSSSHVFLHLQVASTVNRAGQKGFTGYQSSACGSLRTSERLTPEMTKQQIPFPKIPFITSLLQGYLPVRLSC